MGYLIIWMSIMMDTLILTTFQRWWWSRTMYYRS